MKNILVFLLLCLSIGCSSTNKDQVIKVVHYSDNGDTISAFDSCMYLSTGESGVDFYLTDGTYISIRDHYAIFYTREKK
jgi:hypothetical protein